MKGTELGEVGDLGELDVHVARARILLSMMVLITLYLDPNAGGFLQLPRLVWVVLLLHLIYSFGTYFALNRNFLVEALRSVSNVLDLVFATAIGILTEGRTSPSFVFFLFAIVAVGFRTGFRATILVTFSSVALYLVVIGISNEFSFYFIRAFYLAIAGYVVCFFGQQRVNFEARLRTLESKAERQSIARSLHDGYIQALAGVNVRLHTFRKLLEQGRSAEVLDQLNELQIGIEREYDSVRAYVRSLAEIDRKIRNDVPKSDTHFEVNTKFAGDGLIVEQVIQIILEAMRNAWRHGKARTVAIDVQGVEDSIKITVNDDGIGFKESTVPPWAIASRVAEFGGSLRIANGAESGARLEIEMPVA